MIARIIKDQSILKILSVMTGTRKFLVCSGGSESKMYKIRNGVPQGSVLAPSLFNIYIGDLPETKSQKLGYADDWALASQSSTFDTIERTLPDVMTQLKRYFDKWYLRMNSSKTTRTAFHLNNHTANITMEVSADGVLLPPQAEPKYLGVTLDRSLTYRTHIEDTSQKLKSRVSIIRKLTATSWGASQSVLRISALSLCYSVAEYAAPVWMRSAHVPKVETQLNEVMRLISGTIRSTPLNWLPTMNNIAPPMVRRETSNQKSFNRIASLPQRTPIVNILAQASDSSRLISRRPFYKSRNDEYSPDHHWRSIWAQDTPVNGDLLNDPTQKLPGFSNLNRNLWTTSNRIINKQGRTQRTGDTQRYWRVGWNTGGGLKRSAFGCDHHTKLLLLSLKIYLHERNVRYTVVEI